MQASEYCISKIKEFEGLSLVAYKPVPTERNYTIGYGHYAPDIRCGQRITKEYAEFLLKSDLVKVERQVNALGLSLTQGQYDALVDFVFNLGIGKLNSSTLLKKIKAHAPTTEIQAQFNRWVYADGKVLQGLVKRRKWECEMWAKG